MSCHICANIAIGLCRQCFKFYCQEHGDGFCSSCQQCMLLAMLVGVGVVLIIRMLGLK